jgi:hypothetical protein
MGVVDIHKNAGCEIFHVVEHRGIAAVVAVLPALVNAIEGFAELLCEKNIAPTKGKNSEYVFHKK